MSMQKKSPPRLWSFNQGQTSLALLLVVLIQIPPPATGQPVAPEVDPENNKSIATIMGIVALMFLLSGFLSLYSGKCSDNREGARFDPALPTGGSGRRAQNQPSNGLNQEVIDTFPTFRYSDVKGLKIGKSTLACAVCLNEFQDDETLRLIPKCNHVYHDGCIDVWLVSHSTCPVCRANLVPRPDDTTVVSIQMPEDHELGLNEEEPAVRDTGEDHKRECDVESPKVDLLRRCRTMNNNYQNLPTRSRSTGFLSALLFPRSNSMGGAHWVLAQPGEDCERFTLRLPEEVRNQMLTSTLKRANSCVNFTRMSSGTWGYRTRSVRCGLGSGRGFVQHERFGSEEQHCGFSLTPPNFVRSGWNNNRSGRKGKSPVRCYGVALDNNNGERSSDLLCPRS